MSVREYYMLDLARHLAPVVVLSLYGFLVYAFCGDNK
jgi:hypothetical protein